MAVGKSHKLILTSFFIFLLVLSLDVFVFMQYYNFFISKTHMIDTATFYYALESQEPNKWIEGTSKLPTESKIKFKQRTIFLVDKGYFVRPLKFGYAYAENEKLIDEFVNETYSKTVILGLIKSSNMTILLVNYTAPLSEYTHNSTTWPRFIINSSNIILLEIHNYLFTSTDSQLLHILFFKNPLFCNLWHIPKFYYESRIPQGNTILNKLLHFSTLSISSKYWFHIYF